MLNLSVSQLLSEHLDQQSMANDDLAACKQLQMFTLAFNDDALSTRHTQKAI